MGQQSCLYAKLNMAEAPPKRQYSIGVEQCYQTKRKALLALFVKGLNKTFSKSQLEFQTSLPYKDTNGGSLQQDASRIEHILVKYTRLAFRNPFDVSLLSG